MGNCMKRSKQTEQEEEQKFDYKEEEEEEEEEKAKAGDSLKESGALGSTTGGGVRVKLVLTKEELEWLVFQLKSNNGGGGEKKSLESALGEIERGRERIKVVESTWKPSLNSITENPE